MRAETSVRFVPVYLSRHGSLFLPALIFCVVAFYPGDLLASDSIVLSDLFQHARLAPYIDYFEDAGASLGIRDIIAENVTKQFRRNTMKVPNFGITASAYWLRFKAINRNQAEKTWILECKLPVMESIEVFVPDGSGGFDRQVSGMNIPFNSRPIKHLNHIFKIQIQPKESSTVYIRLRSNTTILANFHLWDSDYFTIYDHREQLILGATIGVFLVLVTIHLLLALLTRDRSALYSMAFISAFGIYQFCLEGFCAMHFWPESVWWSVRSPIFFGSLSIIAGMQFARHFIYTKKEFPSTDALIRFLMLLAAAATVGLFVDYKHANIVSAAAAFIGCPVILLTSIRGWIRGISRVRYFLAAWFLFLFCAFFFVMVIMGIFYPRLLSWNGVRIGFGAAGVLFAISLADRFAAMQEKNRLQIENIVEQRTRELDRSIEFLRNEIRERKRAEAALEISESRFRLIAENSTDAIWTMNPQGKLTYISPAIKELTGRDPESLIGKSITPHLLPDSAEKMNRILQAVREGTPDMASGPKFLELQMYRTDGSIAEIEVSAAAVKDDEGDAIGLQGSARNIEERKKAEKQNAGLEEQLRQSQKMEAIGHLAGGVAHDFNNYLTGIIGYSGILLFDLPKDDPRRDQVEQIKMAADKASTLTQQLLAFSRKQIITPQVLDINDNIEQFRKMLRRIIGEDIDFQFDLNPDLWAVKADPGQIDQILVNLSVNARDAMPKGGLLRFETNNVKCDARYCLKNPGMKEGKYILFKVVDTGCGMDSETRKRIFEPFYTTKDKDKGTGLGLSTVYGIVKQNNGFIYVESEPDKGTVVSIYLPSVDEKAEPYVGLTAKDLPSGSETILVAEDEVMVRRLAEAMLTRQGYNVITAPDGSEALALFEERKDEIDLLLTDIVMPKINGRELYEKISAVKPEIKVLFMSGYSEELVENHGILEKGAVFVQKPFTVQTLSRQVRETLDR